MTRSKPWWERSETGAASHHAKSVPDFASLPIRATSYFLDCP